MPRPKRQPRNPFTQVLPALRKELGLSQDRLAQAAGVPAATIRNLEQGRTTDPHWSIVLKLARALGVSLVAFE